MKRLKKIAALFLALALVMGLSMTAMADTNTGTITIKNAAKGETYTIYKLFDATYADGHTAYYGVIPTNPDLTPYFSYLQSTATGATATDYIAGPVAETYYIDGSKTTELSDDAKAALKSWADAQTTNAGSQTGTGGEVVFDGLDYGYYVVISTQNGGTAITVDSVNPNAEIYDKNATEPSVPEGGQVKTVAEGDKDVSIGDIITYTIRFTTSNYDGSGEAAKQIKSYTITDVLPGFLETRTVTSIKVVKTTSTTNDEGNEVTNTDETNLTVQQFTDNAITIDWVDENNNSLYDNGVDLVITYTAVVTNNIEVGGAADANKNNVSITWTHTDDTTNDKGTVTGEATISTYAAAIQKVDENNQPLAGATFQIKGLTVTGKDGVYTVVSYDPSEASAVAGTTMEADDNGLIVILGIASDETLVATEVAAPAGYNRLTDTVEFTPVQTNVTVTATATDVYYDADGVKVEKQTDTTTTKTEVTTIDAVKNGAQSIVNAQSTATPLPTTGGMGTTIFYTVGGVLVLAAVILIITKKRMNAEG